MNNDIIVTERTISPEEMEALLPTLNKFDVQAIEAADKKAARKNLFIKAACAVAAVVEVAAIVAYFVF